MNNDSYDPLTRREFIAAGISSGFALAVLPTTAWAISTSATGVNTGKAEIPVQGGSLPVYFAWPKTKGPHPVVLVVHEIFGVHEYIQDVCRRFAHLGYFAISPYLYFRQGDVTQIDDIKNIIAQVVSKVSMNQVLLDLDSTLSWLSQSKPEADTKRVGITGFCWGGKVVWMYSDHNPKVKAGGAWYGKLTGTVSATESRFPVDIAGGLKVPVLGLYGGKDSGIPLEDVKKMQGLLTQGTSHSEITVFPDAEHGFHADYRPSYHEASAKKAWEQLTRWFSTHGLKPKRH